MESFDAVSTLSRLKNEAALRRKTTYRRSRLDRYTAEILQLQAAGATPTLIRQWLREQRVKVVLSTVTRWLDTHQA